MPRREQDRDAAQRIASELGSRVRGLRRHRGWTQELASEKLGMSPEAYARIERGQSLPSFPTFMRLCEVMETTPDAMLARQEGAAAEPAVDDPHDVARRRLCTLIEDLDGDAVRAVEGVVKVLRRRRSS